MEKDTKQNKSTAQNIRKQFDQILDHHIERLFGSRYGVEALSLNLTTISCIILLAERENEIYCFPSTPSDRYTHETLLNELVEIGLEKNENLEMALRDMIQKGYIDANDNGRYFAKNPTITMAKLLDRTFPKMPGKNFIAYFVQTMDEAQSGRKDLDSAISQLDQMLKMQGVSFLKQNSKPKLKKASRYPVKGHAKLRRNIKIPPISPSGSKIISSEYLNKVEIRKLFAEIDEPTEESSIVSEISSDPSLQLSSEQVSNKRNQLDEVTSKFTPPETIPPAQKESLPISESEETKADLRKGLDVEWGKDESLRKESKFQMPESKHETEMVQKEDSFEKVDDVIEKRVVTFEEDLAMQCPMCKIAKVLTKQTATGRTYYKCSNKDCIFISWGKPYHIVCPQCHNPFLIETLNRDEKPILKCPRATCRYWQKLPGEIPEEYQEKDVLQAQGPDTLTKMSRKPRRRVVRRRVVRRKR